MDVAKLNYTMVKTRGLSFEVAQQGAGDRLALLLHGFPECAYSYRFQIPLLTRLGYRVWAPHLRGYGRSDKPLGRRAYAADELERDITDLIDASGAKSVLLVGHDWGGAVAWTYGMYGPRPLEGLVIMNSPHPMCFRRGLRDPAQLRRSWYMFLHQLPWLPELLLRANDYAFLERGLRDWAVHKEHFAPADMAVYRANIAQPGALTAMINYYRAMPWSMRMLSQRGVKSVKAPTLMIWGEQDVALGKELTVGTENYVDDFSLRFVPDASHWVQQDAPAAVNAHLESWLTSRGLAPSAAIAAQPTN
jgi:pimeloyl-ACP methyl ester carboxylesterase